MTRVRDWVGNLGLWPRMALAISFGFLALFAAFFILGERALQEVTDRLLDERLVIAQMAAAQIDLFLEEALSELEQARRFADFDPLDSSLSEEFHVLSHTYGRVGIFDPGISFIDGLGEVIFSEPSDLYPPGTDLSNVTHIAQVLANQEATISDPFLNPLTNQPVVAVTVPIFNDAEMVGLLSGQIALSSQAVTDPLNRAAALGHSGHAILVNGQGETLASTFNAPFLTPGEHVNFYQMALSLNEPLVETVVLEYAHEQEDLDIHHVMAFATLEHVPWGVAVGGDTEETFAGLKRLRIGLTLLGTIALLSTWAATLWGTRRLVKPVQRLTEAAQRIADHELETPLYVSEGGEIGAMADALERMRILLLSNIRDLSSWNETLEARVAERTQELRRHEELVQTLLSRAIDAQEEERARLARELHDDIGQMLTAIQLSLDQLAKIPPGDRAEFQQQRSRVRELTDIALNDLRRIIADVRPGVLSELGLLPALEWIADRTLRQTGLEVDIDAIGRSKRLPNEIEIPLFRIAQESMGNIARHSEAEHVRIELKREESRVVLTLSDDGRGFDPLEVETSHPDGGGLGLAGMKERAAMVGGTITISSSKGEGTTIQVIIPIPN